MLLFYCVQYNNHQTVFGLKLKYINLKARLNKFEAFFINIYSAQILTNNMNVYPTILAATLISCGTTLLISSLFSIWDRVCICSCQFSYFDLWQSRGCPKCITII